MSKTSCCTPARGAWEGPKGAPAVIGNGPMDCDARDIPGGMAIVGTSNPGIPDDGEGPLRRVKVKPFRISPTTITNIQFRSFIEATGYLTEAERFGWSFVFWAQVPAHIGATEGVVDVEWWRRVDGASWFAPNGPGTEEDCKEDHPAVHISWNDARAYSDWAGGRLPTEAEWEHAARGGRGDVPFPWGIAEPDDVEFVPCNIWQGQFPETNTGRDGFMTTAPAKSFEANEYGLYNMVGNVWEWTADAYRIKSLKKTVKERLRAMRGYKVSKGGSFLCHRSYCFRYRIAARSGTSPDSTTTHHGFRVVWDK
ncbi:MAG: formylglycine-generating enzyme family protein [Pseudomonadota bacterium]